MAMSSSWMALRCVECALGRSCPGRLAAPVHLFAAGLKLLGAGLGSMSHQSRSQPKLSNSAAADLAGRPSRLSMPK